MNVEKLKRKLENTKKKNEELRKTIFLKEENLKLLKEINFNLKEQVYGYDPSPKKEGSAHRANLKVVRG